MITWPALIPLTQVENLAIKRFYATVLEDTINLLEVVGDAQSRAPRRRGLAQVHITPASYAAALKRSKQNRHAYLAPNTDEHLPFDANSFDAVLCHGCLPYIERPLLLFNEMFRLLRPGGVARVSWVSTNALIELGETRDELRNTALAWRDAMDEAERLYIAASISRYSASWEKVQVDELPLDGNHQGGLFVMTAHKPSVRQLQKIRVQKDIHSQRFANRPSNGAESNYSSNVAASIGHELSLQAAAQAAREQAQLSTGAEVPAKESSHNKLESGLSNLTTNNVRAKILETMKRGITKARDRSDLGEGEQKLLDHMKMYVMESKFAELDLTEEERAIWEELKSEYVSTRESSE